MAEVTKADIGELHKRIDILADRQNDTNIVLAKIDTTLKLLPKLPSRPCDQHNQLKTEFDGHLTAHKETKQTWQRPLVRTVVDLVKMAIVATVTWLFLRQK